MTPPPAAAGEAAHAGLPWLSGDLHVLDLVVERGRSGSRPGDREDPHRIALVVEGGGMRGVCIGGMVRALHQAGLGGAFDDVYAVSAGAFSVAGLLVGNVEHAVSAYAEDLATGGFVDWRRFLARKGPLISLDFLIEEVMERRLGFDFARLSETAPVLRPIVTDLDALTPVALTGLHSAADWRNALRASATIPLLAGPPVALHGRRYVDGFLGDALPLARAIAAGASHVLALVSRAPGERLRTGGMHGRRLAAHAYDRVAPGLAALVAERATSYADSLAIVTDRDHRHRGDAHVLALRPTHAAGVGSLTSDRDRLRRAGVAGEDAVRHALAAVPRPPHAISVWPGRSQTAR